jgi:hypothetical protein
LLEAQRLHLEDPIGLAGYQQLEDLGVVEGNAPDVQLNPALANQLQGVIDHRQGLQAQEIELDQADLLHLVLGELGGQHPFLPHEHRNVVQQGFVGDDYSGGVGAVVTVEALQRTCHLDHLAVFVLLFLHLLQPGLLVECLLQGDVGADWHHLGDPVGLLEGEPHHPAHVLYGQLGLELPEGDDLPHPVVAVLLTHVVDDLAAAVLAEVDVEIGHADALGVQEALEQQAVGKRIQVGDPQGIRHQRTGARAPPGPHRNPLLLGVSDEVPDDQEVAGETHALDDVQLVVQALVISLVLLLRDRGQVTLQPLFGLGLQETVQIVALGDRVMRQVDLLQIQLQRALLGYLGGVLQSLGEVFEQALHLLGRTHVQFVGVVPHAAGIVDGRAGGDAQKNVVGPVIALVEVVTIVGGHQRQLGLGGELCKHLVDHRLLLETVLLDLQIELAGLEDGGILQGRLPGGFHPPLLDPRSQLAAEAGRERGQPAAVLAQQVLVHPRVVIESVQVPLANQGAEVVVPLPVAGDQHQVVDLPRGAVTHALGTGHVHLATNDGLDPCGLRPGVKVDRTEHVAVVGNRHGLHPQIRQAFHQLVETDGAVK